MQFKNKFADFEIDVVGLLAILGEGSIDANAHVITFSKWCLLPRILPAPQVLLPSQRPENLKAKEAHITGVFSGNVTSCINHLAHVLVDAEEMQRNETRCVRIIRDPDHPNKPIRPRMFSPLFFVNLVGCGCSIGLLVASIMLNDGMSLLGTLCLSILSTLTGIANNWKLAGGVEVAAQDAPDGDLVIRYPNGSFLVVKCNDQVARELYFTREDIDYTMIKDRGVYRTVSLFGTLLLMLGVIFLANSTRPLQISWAVVFIVLNAAYWAFAAMPKGLHWDLSRYKVTEVGIEGRPFTDDRFTDALFKAILFARGAAWAKMGESAAPRTQVWDDWLEQAEIEARNCQLIPDVEPEKYEKHLNWPGRVPFSGEMQTMPDTWRPRAAWAALNNAYNAKSQKTQDNTGMLTKEEGSQTDGLRASLSAHTEAEVTNENFEPKDIKLENQ